MLFKLTIPGDANLVPALRQVAERVAQCAGYTAADAAHIADSVGRAVEIVLARFRPGTAPRPTQSLDIRFEREDAYLDVWVRYAAGNGDWPTVDPSLSGELREGVDSADFGREGDMEYCRLRRRLPREKVDHQCELPPDTR